MEENLQVHEQENKFDGAVKRNVLPYLMDLAIVLCLILIVFLFCFRIAVVDGSSMYDTLIHNDYVLLLNHVLAGEPKHGDIVVISKDSYEDGTPIIKRVIATEGQKVDINFDTGEVSVDGKVLDEPYIYTPTKTFEGTYFPLTVDEGCVFVLGDNRKVSKDSRDPEIGLIDCREIVGKAIFLFFPGEDPATGQRQFDRIGAIG